MATAIPVTPDRPAATRLSRGPRLLAMAVVLQPLLIGVNAVFHPEVDISGQGLLAGAADGPTRWFAVHVTAAVGAVLGVPAAFGLRRLVRVRGRVLADTAVAAAVVAGVVLSTTFVAEASVLRLLAIADIPEASAVTVAEDYTNQPEFYAVGVGVLAAAAAGVLLAVALLRDGRVPRWQPWAYLVGTIATLAAAPGTPLGPVAFGIVTVASVGLAYGVASDRVD